jgi:excisionase family DNA binding protein
MAKHKPKDPPLLINREAAAFQLGVSVCSLDALVRSGELPYVRLGSRILFLRSVLFDFALSRLERRRSKLDVVDEARVESGSLN